MMLSYTHKQMHYHMYTCIQIYTYTQSSPPFRPSPKDAFSSINSPASIKQIKTMATQALSASHTRNLSHCVCVLSAG